MKKLRKKILMEIIRNLNENEGNLKSTIVEWANELLSKFNLKETEQEIIDSYEFKESAKTGAIETCSNMDISKCENGEDYCDEDEWTPEFQDCVDNYTSYYYNEWENNKLTGLRYYANIYLKCNNKFIKIGTTGDNKNEMNYLFEKIKERDISNLDNYFKCAGMNTIPDKDNIFVVVTLYDLNGGGEELVAYLTFENGSYKWYNEFMFKEKYGILIY